MDSGTSWVSVPHKVDLPYLLVMDAKVSAFVTVSELLVRMCLHLAFLHRLHLGTGAGQAEDSLGDVQSTKQPLPHALGVQWCPPTPGHQTWGRWVQ